MFRKSPLLLVLFLILLIPRGLSAQNPSEPFNYGNAWKDGAHPLIL
jgi:hypothetical protein